MKTTKYLFLLLTAAGLVCGAQSCKQDLGQNPPFNYPTEDSGNDDEGEGEGDEGGSTSQFPDALYHLAFEDDLKTDGTLAGSVTLHDGDAEAVFDTGAIGKGYQNANGQALILTPDAESLSALAELKSFTVAMWIKFDGSNAGSTNLFSLGNSADAVGNIAFFLNNGNAQDPGSFYFKGYFGTTTGTTWFDLGGDTTITGMADSWQHVALSFDGETSTMTLWHNGTVKSSYTWDGLALGFKNLTGFVLGAFPAQVGLGATGDWTATADFYTGMIDEVYLFGKALTADEMTALYNRAE